MLGETIEMSREAGPLIVLRFTGRSSDEEFDSYLSEYSKVLAEGARYAAVLVTTADARMTPIGQARKQARWLADNEAELRRLCAGIAFVLPSPVSRGVYRAMAQMRPSSSFAVTMWGMAQLEAMQRAAEG